ncbi:hypothetical protein K3495_g3109 [Podosphaera aphanis]|nr:hypothetical protein K3495_g3109 [Podosphaera aphanis]
MATEATSENIVKTSTLSTDELMTTTENPSISYTDISEENHLKSGKLKQEDVNSIQTKVSSTAASVNGGSDSEASKTEISKSEGEEKSHFRTASTVKKLTSFKPVSVNKKFLAAKGTTTITPSKLGDGSVLGSTPAQVVPLVGGNTARPRLVAKSGPGLHSTPRATATSSASRVTGAPDASAVWNKNRPVPPPEPKRFTDEELKQRYGIHLATRLQTDDAGKQANWADIDDDDDDWAPNTMEWADGTKVTLPKADEKSASTPTPTPAPPLQPVQPVVETEAVTVPKVKVAEPVKMRSAAPTQKPSSATVRAAGFPGRAGLVLKGAAEKPTLVAKPPGPPTPVKSPWAPLPPVEKVVPSIIETSQAPQPQQNRLNQKESSGPNEVPLPPAKEIAADDFSRSWRETPSTSKELYNAQSGRYEPANDNRRGSVRSDARSHQPAVLQRPHQEGPAEPSPAFQTHRASGQDNPSRRRNSSNVSGVSETVLKRISRSDMPSQETLPVRKGSLASTRDDLVSPSSFSSVSNSQNLRTNTSQAWQPRPPSTAIQTSPQTKRSQVVAVTAPVVSTAPVDNQTQAKPILMAELIEFQRKEMQLKRELAIARRKEEKEQEEAEKKERIRIKLESMGPSPAKKKKDLPKIEKPTTTQTQTPQTQAPVDTNVAPADSEPAANEAIVSSSPKVSDSKKQKVDSSSAEPSLPEIYLPPDARPNGNLQLQEGLSPQSQPSNEVQPPQSWHSNSSDNFKPWSSAHSQQSSSRNVWGPPTNDRTLGNGTFNPELSRVPEITTHPGPIGPLNLNRGKSHGNDREYGLRPAPIGPPNRRRQSQNTPEDSSIRSAVANSGWGSLPQKIAEEDARRAQQQDIEISRSRELREKGLIADQPPAPPVVQDTWRQVSIKEDGSRSQIHSNHASFHSEQAPLWKGQKETKTARGIFEEPDVVQRRHLDTIGAPPQFSDAWRSTPKMNVPLTRGSRFFPNRDIRLEENAVTFDRPESPSPPPPTQHGHPAYEGNVARPHVSLPRPVPVVKLPPPKLLAPIGPPKPISFAAIVATPVVPAKDRVAPRPVPSGPPSQSSRREEPVAGNWQERIYSLMGRKSTPLKKSALAVDSSSKKALEVPRQKSSATVFLPLISGDSMAANETIESKPPAEICFEEQEMGSLPLVKMPVKPPTAAWDLAPPPKPLLRKFMVSQITSIEAISFPQLTANNHALIKIKIPGQLESRNVSHFITRQKSNPRRGGNRVNGGSRHPAPSNRPSLFHMTSVRSRT